MLTIDYLREFGADIQEGMERCMNDEAFYLELVDMVLDDESFEELSSAVKADDKKAAFSAAHALKGLTANVALTPLATVITEMTDLLREEKNADYPAYLDRILQMRDTLLSQRDST